MEKIKREIHKMDATNQSVGRLATKISILLQGKNKPAYQPYLDNGDCVEINNISKLKFTGKKLDQKKFKRYSGYPGGLKETKMSVVLKKNPNFILQTAVKRMLPNNKLRKNRLKRLKFIN